MITAGRHGAGSDDGLLVQTVQAAARAGAHLIQIREHGLEAGHLARLVRACLQAVAGSRARVVVNDRLDVALATGAHGVHLRETSVPARDVRAIAPRGFLIGRSVHTAEDAARLGREGSLDYLIFGAVFPTPAKAGASGRPGSPAPGCARHDRSGPRGRRRGRFELPAAVARTGAAGLAAIRWWSEVPAAALPAATQELAAAFAAGRPRADNRATWTSVPGHPCSTRSSAATRARDIRMLAAAGGLAPRAFEQVEILLLLRGDADAEVAATAEKTLQRPGRGRRGGVSGQARGLARGARLLRRSWDCPGRGAERRRRPRRWWTPAATRRRRRRRSARSPRCSASPA